jgi:hypothetical protein
MDFKKFNKWSKFNVDLEYCYENAWSVNEWEIWDRSNEGMGIS